MKRNEFYINFIFWLIIGLCFLFIGGVIIGYVVMNNDVEDYEVVEYHQVGESYVITYRGDNGGKQYVRIRSKNVKYTILEGEGYDYAILHLKNDKWHLEVFFYKGEGK